jgi:hypothetical protein
MAKANKKNTTKANKGAARKAFFEANGDVSSWRGRATAFTDRRKEASRKACRGKRWSSDQ